MKTEKLCVQCGLTKPASEFYIHTYKNRNPCLYKLCKLCHNADNPNYKPQVPRSEDEKKEASKEKKRKYYQRLKKQVFDAYANICACCGETTPEFLTLDHVNNDGAEHKRQLQGNSRAGGTSVFLDVIRQHFPDTFQLLCYNCNCSKQFAGGCPHQRDNK